jgi:hypothetical protein
VPSLQAVFDGTADVPRHVLGQLGDHRGLAVNAWRAGGDAVTPGGGVDGDHSNAQLCGDVCVRALPVLVLLTQPVLVNLNDGG